MLGKFLIASAIFAALSASALTPRGARRPYTCQRDTPGTRANQSCVTSVISRPTMHFHLGSELQVPDWNIPEAAWLGTTSIKKLGLSVGEVASNHCTRGSDECVCDC
jgi:hypothetical protein